MRAFSATLLLIFSAAVCAEQPSALTSLSAQIESALANSKKPGIVIGITDRDKTLRVYLHGFADLKTREPLTAESRFAIGSISKAFTSIALMETADEGKFDPRAPLTRYLPSLKIRSNYPAMTGRDVMSHTAGLPYYLADAASSRFVQAALKDFTPAYAPGAHWSYSNTGYQLLGYALENIEQRPYPEIIRDRLLIPAGMLHTSAIIDDAERKHMVVSYTRWPYDGSYVEASWYEYTAGDGSIVSTIEDMCAYARLLLNKGSVGERRLLSNRAFAELTTPVLEDYAYGLWVRRQGGHTVISHSGGIAGFSSYLEAHSDEGFAVMILSNGGIDPAFQAWLLGAVGSSLRGEAVPAPPAPERPAIEAKLDDYVGIYHDSSAGTAARGDEVLTVTLTEGGLSLARGHAEHRLQRIGADTFRIAGSDEDHEAYLFSRAGGKRDGAVVEVSHGAQWYVTKDFHEPAAGKVADDYSALVGHYVYSGPEGPVARVYVRNGSLIAVLFMDENLYALPLERGGPGVYLLKESPVSAEPVRFDSLDRGHATRMTISGLPLYRRDTP
jgi:CubicO group peptidase (beta-lactamase class C family)